METDIYLAGIVTAKHRTIYEVQTEQGMLRCHPRGKLRRKGNRPGVPIAVGDRVTVRLLEQGRGIIDGVCERSSGLDRTATEGQGVQTLAANAEQAIIVFAAAEPRPDLFMLDRLLLLAVAGGLEAVICLNKCDLRPPEALEEQMAAYRESGFPVIFTSATACLGLEKLQEVLRDRRSVLCGPSGVGKSSLVNALAPGLTLHTQGVGPVTHKGRHATTGARLLELPFGGAVADTPGLRQAGLGGVTPEHLEAVFPEVARVAARCRFPNCRHHGEHGCAVWEALVARRLDSRRVRSFRQLREEAGC